MLSGSVNSFGEIAIVKMSGYVDQRTAVELERIVDTLLAKASYKIIVDLHGVEYLSSAGWGILLGSIKMIRGNDGDLKLVGLQPNVREVFELLEFNHILREFYDVNAAIADFLSDRVSKERQRVSAQCGIPSQPQFRL